MWKAKSKLHRSVFVRGTPTCGARIYTADHGQPMGSQEVTDNNKKIADYWKGLCEKYPMNKEQMRKTA
jgi:hypothetical protein